MGSRSTISEDEDYEQIPPKSVAREYAETILVCVIFVLFSRAFIFQQSEIPSGSMEDTILEGDYILVNRFQYAPTIFDWERAILPSRDIKRGDVVVFKQPVEPETDYIKRVIGLPGDLIEVRNDYVRVNGAYLDEPYVGGLYHRGGLEDEPHRVFVPEGHVFVMGDHRNRSSDGRVFGPIPIELLKGKAFLVLFSTRAKTPEGARPGQVTVISLFRKIYNLFLHNRLDRAFLPIR